jgi:hypothetical protein
MSPGTADIFLSEIYYCSTQATPRTPEDPEEKYTKLSAIAFARRIFKKFL